MPDSPSLSVEYAVVIFADLLAGGVQVGGHRRGRGRAGTAPPARGGLGGRFAQAHALDELGVREVDHDVAGGPVVAGAAGVHGAEGHAAHGLADERRAADVTVEEVELFRRDAAHGRILTGRGVAGRTGAEAVRPTPAAWCGQRTPSL